MTRRRIPVLVEDFCEIGSVRAGDIVAPRWRGRCSLHRAVLLLGRARLMACKASIKRSGRVDVLRGKTGGQCRDVDCSFAEP